MKKLLSLFIVFVMIFSLSACSLGADKKAIENTITRIEANELDSALNIIKDMDEKTLSVGKTDILAAIIGELNVYLNTNSWVSTDYYLVKEDVITDIVKYKSILDALSLDSDETNADDFVWRAFTLKRYVKWNTYYSADDTYLTEAQTYMNQGAIYKSTPSIASKYYTMAYDIAMDAYYNFQNSTEYGMQEAADFYYNYAVQINGIISRNGTTITQDNTYNTSSSAYKKILNEYTDACDEIIAIVEEFPTKLY